MDNEPALSCVTSTRCGGAHHTPSHPPEEYLPESVLQDDPIINDVNSIDGSTDGWFFGKNLGSPKSGVENKRRKHNTCFTSAVMYLNQGKRIVRRHMNCSVPFYMCCIIVLISVLLFYSQVARYTFEIKKLADIHYCIQLEHSLVLQNCHEKPLNLN